MFTICFDFPDGGDPMFAWMGPEGWGFTTSLSEAARFESDDVTQRTLTNAYGPTSEYGAVVEVGQ